MRMLKIEAKELRTSSRKRNMALHTLGATEKWLKNNGKSFVLGCIHWWNWPRYVFLWHLYVLLGKTRLNKTFASVFKCAGEVEKICFASVWASASANALASLRSKCTGLIEKYECYTLQNWHFQFLLISLLLLPIFAKNR